MIIATNPKPSISEFRYLMKNADAYLNKDASERPKYYAQRGGNPLEEDVRDALVDCAKGTPFENTIELISGQKFPDIIAAKLYGVEVKSTKDDHWTTTGSSILESTRVHGIERIYITFGKLGGPTIEFLSRPYEECLYDIAVTHMPRYLINMQLTKNETIFAKMGISYDDLRNSNNPFAPISKYYRSQLKEGESLWWASDFGDEIISPKIRLWKKLSPDEKRNFMIHGCVFFPEIFGGDYDNYSLWLTSQGVVDPHIRDQFSAGGKVNMTLPSGYEIPFPGVYRRIKNNVNNFIQLLANKEPTIESECAPVRGTELKKRLLTWCDKASVASSVDYLTSMNALCNLFFSCSYREIKQSISKPQLYSDKKPYKITCRYCGKTYFSPIGQYSDRYMIREDDTCPYCNTSNNTNNN